MQAGARGYLLKGASKSDMLRAIRGVAGGAAIISPTIARRMMSYFKQLETKAAAYAFPELTPREHEVLALMTQQHSSREIAESLSLSLMTMRNYVSNIFAKLQLADRTGASSRRGTPASHSCTRKGKRQAVDSIADCPHTYS